MNHWNYTTEELARLWRNVGNQDIAEAYERLAEAYERLADAEKELEELEARVEKENEVALEQSEFRRELIERIVEMCGQGGTKKDLVNAIKTALENSYVEL